MNRELPFPKVIRHCSAVIRVIFRLEWDQKQIKGGDVKRFWMPLGPTYEQRDRWLVRMGIEIRERPLCCGDIVTNTSYIEPFSYKSACEYNLRKNGEVYI